MIAAPHDSRMMTLLGFGNGWYVKETECYPNKFKVVPTDTNPVRETNDISNFFPTRAEAQREADRRSEDDAERRREEYYRFVLLII